MIASPSGSTIVAGVVGAPVEHSLSPTLHNTWIAAAGIDAVYVAFGPTERGFVAFADGMRGGAVRGVNVTAPFKEAALALADQTSERATAAGAANLLIFENTGLIFADNTDGVGLIAAFAEQAPGFELSSGPIVILGAGGAARGASTALLAAGAPQVRVINRSGPRGEALVGVLGERSRFYPMSDMPEALVGAVAIVNATTLGLNGAGEIDLALELAAPDAVVMDMNYKPLTTALLRHAASAGLRTVDGLAMLIGQAAPSFEALFGCSVPPVDVRTIALAALGKITVIVIGLTGSIGMGKSTTAQMFAAAGVPVYDADAEVRTLYAVGGAAVGPIEEAFPGVSRDGAIDRALLGDRVLGDREALNRLNGIVWPMMGAARSDFFQRATTAGALIVVLDIPLLLETGGEKNVDAVVVVSAPEGVQRERVLARPGMTSGKLDAILAAQMPDEQKRRRADFVIDTGRGMEEARTQVARVLEALNTRNQTEY